MVKIYWMYEIFIKKNKNIFEKQLLDSLMFFDFFDMMVCFLYLYRSVF